MKKKRIHSLEKQEKFQALREARKARWRALRERKEPVSKEIITIYSDEQ